MMAETTRLPCSAKLQVQLAKEMMTLLQTGDLIIANEVTYFEPHLGTERVQAQSLYDLFENWAIDQNPKVPITDRNFYRIMFNVFSRLNAHKKVQVRVNEKDSTLHIMLNHPQLEVQS